MPAGFLSVAHGRGAALQALLEDPRVRFFAFTGSTEVGREIQQAAGLRRTQMELGSIAFTILCDDADLDRALPRSEEHTSELQSLMRIPYVVFCLKKKHII